MSKPLIHITGDPTVDWLNPSQDVDPGTGPYFFVPDHPAPEAQISSQAGGAALLTEFLRHLAGDDKEMVQGITLDPAFLTNPTHCGITRAWSTWKLQDGPNGHSTFRIADWGRYEYCLWDYTYATLTGDPELLIIDDTGHGFRDHAECWPTALAATKPYPQAPAEIILKLAQYKNPAKPLPVLDALLRNRLAQRTTIVTSLSDLRACPVCVGSSLSWERLFEEIVAAVYNPACPFVDRQNPHALRIKQVLVTIETSGAVLVRPEGNLLIFDRAGQEGDFARRFTGEMMGFNTAVLGALASAYLEKGGDMDWQAAMRNGMALARELLFCGYPVTDKRLAFPFERLKAALQRADDAAQAAKPGDVWYLGCFTDTRHHTITPSGDWTILEDVIRQQADVADMSETDLSQAVLACACDVVCKGPEKAKALANVPVESVGKWRSADRHEIEGVRSVNNAMRDYLALANPDTPLAIAVFGPPGAGKSFAIKEIARGLGIDKDAQLTFNLSQFESPDELTRAFHQIRDMHLKGKMPLVFWDEFDTPCNDQTLGWLRHFLAPIQDGICVDHGMVHPIGGGIFVFAGGTCKSFAEFNVVNSPEDRAAKKPDFISRLRAYIDIKGPNGDPNSIVDPLYMVRRAFLLNTFLTRYAGHLNKNGCYAIGDHVLNAFIRTTRYYHGARSMESLVRTSALKGKGSYELSSLPPQHLLSMHVHADDFLAHTRSGYREMLRVGVTGHIGLDPNVERMKALISGIDTAIELIAAKNPARTLTVFSPLAKGADRLVAREVFRHHPDARLIAVLPVPAEDYINDFGKTDLHHEDYDGAEYRQEFRYLLDQRAIEIITMPPCESRNAAYEQVGYFTATHCDVLIAVWDGNESQGQGGTGDIVRYALSIGKPVIHVWAGNYKENEAKRTDVGDKHGTIRYSHFDAASSGEWHDHLVSA